MSRRAVILSIVSVLLVGITVAVTKPAGADVAAPAPLLAYAKYQSVDGPSSIYTAHLDGSGAVLRIQNATAPELSPDATRIAFIRGSQLWVADADGANQVAVANGVADVSWSPDATRLVGDRAGSLVIVTVATHAVTAIPASAGEWGPQWSPDGTLIASNGPGGQVLRRPDGTSRVVRRGVSTGPWSPDGLQMLSVGFDSLDVIDVLSGASTPALPLRPTSSYPGLAWRVDDSPAFAYIGVSSNVPYAPPGYDLLTGPSGPAYDHWTVIAANSLYPTTGGLTPTDANGPPPAVTDLVATSSPSYVHLSWAEPSNTRDFAGVEVRYSLGDTPPTAVSDGLDGGRLLSSRDLGPLPPDEQMAISVFSRDWSGNIGPAATAVVTTPHLMATTVVAHASRPDVVYQQVSVVSGTVTGDYDGAPVGGVLTIATRQYKTSAPFVARWTQGLAKYNCCFSIMQIPGISTEYQFSYAGDADHAASTGTTHIRVAHRVTNRLDRSSARAGTAVHLTATTLPVLSKGGTYLQIRKNGAVTLGPHATDTQGKVVYTIRAPARGAKAAYRVYVPGVSGYINGYGAWVTITGT